MPSGRTHLRIEATLLVVCAVAAALGADRGWLRTPEIAAFLAAYAFSMLLLSPDLDLAKSDSYRRWGPLRWLWAPYAAAFRHRRISHHPLFGPITRIGYVGLIVLVGAAVYGAVGRRALPQLVVSTRWVLAAVIGLYLPNLAHILADGVQSIWGRRGGRL